MTKEEKIKKRLKLELLESIRKTAPETEDIIDIYLCAIDEPATYNAYIEILAELEDAEALYDYDIEVCEISEDDIPEPQRPTDLEIEDDPVVLDYYYKNIESDKERHINSLGERYHSLKINPANIDLKKINELINKTLTPFIKIIVADYKIIEATKNTLISKYQPNTDVYAIADYLFNISEENWNNWEDIAMYITKSTLPSDLPSTIDYKRKVYDAILSINKISKKKIGLKIIECQAKENYMALK